MKRFENYCEVLPVLYSFRRCPYAMRARLAIVLSKKQVELREVVLKNKPQEMVNVSPKATVPVLLLESGEVIDESLDIMAWFLSSTEYLSCTFKQRIFSSVVQENDESFKYWLDRYKYSDRFPEYFESYYRDKAFAFIMKLEKHLSKQSFLHGDTLGFNDLAILPFVRQFAHVDRDWFFSQSVPACIAWLNTFLDSALFKRVMHKYPAWKEGDSSTVFPH